VLGGEELVASLLLIVLGVLLGARLLDSRLLDLAACGVAVAGDVLLQQPDLLAVRVEAILFYKHDF
jgi:hypothetical protein